MKKYIGYCFSLMLMGLGAQAQVNDKIANLLPIPTGGLPLAQIFDTKVADPSVYQQHLNKVYYVWGAKSAKLPDGIVASKYFPSIRNPDRELTIEWYQKNHPDWVMYQEDKVTPAYGFIYSYGGLVPLDVSNPEVREFYLKEFILPAVKAGYKMVAMDNVDLGNWPKAVGHFVGSTWVPLYTGKKNDTVFHQNMINWMQYLSDKLHPLGVGVSANVKATTASQEVVLRMMNGVDMWLDETGFTHTGKNITDKAWERAFSLLEKVTPSKAYVSINQVNGAVENAPTAQIEWVIANFLLSRGPKSMLAITGFDKTTMYQRFDYRPEMDIDLGEPTGKPHQDQNNAWVRAYAKGMVLVNPSSKETLTVVLPKGKWKRWNGEAVSGKLILAPASGAVLQK